MRKLLFVCSENRLRSATGEALFSNIDGFEAIGAGTNHDAVTPVSGDLIEWADLIICMENVHRDKVTRKYKQLLKKKRIIVLEIADNYGYMQPELIKLLKISQTRFC